MQDLIKAMKSLSDETRLRILNILLQKECCVCEVMQALNISQSRASRNLGILQDAGFLKTRRDRLWIVYSIDWQTANKYAVSLAKLLKDSPLDNKLLKATSPAAYSLSPRASSFHTITMAMQRASPIMISPAM